MEGAEQAVDPSRVQPLLMDQDVAAAERAALRRAPRNGNGERVGEARLAVVDHVDREGAWLSIVTAGATESGHSADDRKGGESHAVHLRAALVINVLQVALYRAIYRL